MAAPETTMIVNVEIKPGSELDRRLGGIERMLKILLKQGEHMADLVDQVTQDVAAEETVEASMEQLLTNLAQQIKDAGTDTVKLNALHTMLLNDTAAMSAAVVANTPAAPDANGNS
jgi:predicted transcriptional regulator